MYILVETTEYVDGERRIQLCGTYNDFKAAQSVMTDIYTDELRSDDEYNEDCCELIDGFASVGGEGGFPRKVSWFVFDSDNPIQFVY